MQFESNSYDSKRSDQQQCNTARGNSNKCRCCSAFGIHQDKFGQAEREMLVENLNLYLSSDLRLPQTWCSSCITFLKEVQSFRRKALAVEQELLTASQVVKCEDSEQSFQSNPLEIQISDVKTETDHELDSPFNGTNEEQIVKVSVENPIKIEPGTSTSGDFITIFKSEDESHLEPQKNLSKQQRFNVTPKVEKESDLSPNNKDIKLSKKLELAPLSMKKLPHTSKGIYLVPVNNDSTNVKNGDELPPKGIKRKINDKKNVSKMKKNDTKSDEEKSDSQYDEESSDSDSDAVSHTKEELDETDRAVAATNNLLPEKSRYVYEKCYEDFVIWREHNNIPSSKSFSENVVLVYFEEMSKKYKPTSLWTRYSILRNMFNIKHQIDLSKYSKVLSLLKRKSEGYKAKKSHIFTPDLISMFLNEAPNKKYLLMKVAFIIGLMGACRRHELYQLEFENVKQLESFLVVTIPNTKTRTTRTFTIAAKYAEICMEYIKLRPKNCENRYFFLNYANGKCRKQRVGINKFGYLGKEIAMYLKLPNPHLYTGHCFRRSSATILVDAGGDITSLKRLGGWSPRL